MAITRTFQQYAAVPSAILSDGIIPVPLWAVTAMSLNQSYHLPPIGSSGSRAVMATHDDTITLNGVLAGALRFSWKLALENLAEISKRGSAIGSYSKGRFSGLILVTSMTIRTDMQIEKLSFSISASRREVIDVSVTLLHLPRPGALGKLLDTGALGVAALMDWMGN
jgi:hypothetical protein